MINTEETMTYEEREEWFCEQCKHHDTCGCVKIGNISRCLDIQESMYGWELGRQDTIEAIEGACMNGVTAEEKYKHVLDKIKELKEMG